MNMYLEDGFNPPPPTSESGTTILQAELAAKFVSIHHPQLVRVEHCVKVLFSSSSFVSIHHPQLVRVEQHKVLLIREKFSFNPPPPTSESGTSLGITDSKRKSFNPPPPTSESGTAKSRGLEPQGLNCQFLRS